MSFSNLGLCEPILKAISEQGYTSPTPIQKQAIPLILDKKDVLAGAQTGTGKTAGFTLPLLQRLSEKKVVSQKHQIRALILTPTRELAAQVAQSVDTYGKYLPYKSAVIFGGVGINPQKAQLRKGVDILIATPGRLLDLISQGCLDLSRVEFFVLDEADRMLDMGFIHDIKKVLKLLPSHRQNLLFSATFSNDIKKLADGLLDNPTLIEVARRNTSSEIVEQVVHHVNKNEKRDLLIKLINDGNWQQVLVFTRTKHGANKLSEQLNKFDISSAAIHGNKSQGARTKALANFKNGDVRVLVATDIAARGIDIDQLPHVVNFELPNVSEDYVHRIGRTGRAGNEGVAVSLVCVDEEEYLEGIEKLIKKDIPKVEVEGFIVDPTIKAEPIQKKRGSNSRGNSNSRNKSNNDNRKRNDSRSKSNDDKKRNDSRNRPSDKKRVENKSSNGETRQRRNRDSSSESTRPGSRNTPRRRA